MINEIQQEWKEKKTVIMFTIRLKENNGVIGILDIYDINTIDKKAKIGIGLAKISGGKDLHLKQLKER